MITYFRLTTIILFLILSSCGYYSQYVDKERQLKSCHLQCNMNLDICNKQCRNNEHKCEVMANMQAALRFKEYKKREITQGQIVNEELQSFKDPLQCRKVTCSCQEDFRVCKQSCTGKIYKHLKANTAFVETLNGT